MKFKKLMAAVTTGVLAVTSLSLSGLIGSAEVQELMIRAERAEALLEEYRELYKNVIEKI